MLEKLLKETVDKLKCYDFPYALLGGVVTSFYRKEIRTTQDIDIAILSAGKVGESGAREILRALSLRPKAVRLGTLRGEPPFLAKKTPIAIIGGRVEKGGVSFGVDFLLSSLPWVKDSVRRAQDNLLDFGFAALPVLTVEDIIITKLYSYLSRSDRFKDLDDLQNIFKKGHDLDCDYLKEALLKYQLYFPEVFEQYLSVEVRKFSKKLRKKGKSLKL